MVEVQNFQRWGPGQPVQAQGKGALTPHGVPPEVQKPKHRTQPEALGQVPRPPSPYGVPGKVQVPEPGTRREAAQGTSQSRSPEIADGIPLEAQDHQPGTAPENQAIRQVLGAGVSNPVPSEVKVLEVRVPVKAFLRARDASSSSAHV